MKYVGLLMILIMSLLVGCAAEAVEEQEPVLSTVAVTDAVQETVTKTYVSIGEVVPDNQVDLLVSGKIDEIFLGVGDIVDVDDIILTIEDDRVKSSFNSSESQLRTIRDNLASQYNLAKDDLSKQSQLLTAGVISQAAYNQTANQVENLKRQFNDAAVNYNNQLKNLKENLEAQFLTSTVKGKIAALNVKPGQVASNQVAVSIIDDTMKYIKTSVSSDLLRSIRVGDIVLVMINDEKHEGRIARIDGLPNQQSKLFDVWIEANDGYDYMIGEYAEIQYVLESFQAVVVPTKSIIRKNEETFVYVLNGNTVERIKVSSGLTQGENIVVEGISPGDLILVRGQNYVLDGEKVNVDKGN